MQFIDFAKQQGSVSCFMSEAKKPEVQAGELLIKVEAIGVNRADLLQKAGHYPAPRGESTILGLELCGVIEAKGDNTDKWNVGQKVFGLVAGGAYAEYAIMRSDQAMLLPKRLSAAQGAAVAEVFLTAYQTLYGIAALKQGDNVLIHGGASGVGTAAIQLAKSDEAKVIVTVGSDDKASACLSLGADVALNYKESSYVDWQQQNLPSGFNIILDMVAGEHVNNDVITASLDGRIVFIAMLGGRYAEKLDMALVLGKRLSIHGSTLRNRSHEYRAKLVHDFCKDYYGLLVNGAIKPVIDSVVDWKEVEVAHQRMASNANIGKIILTVNE